MSERNPSAKNSGYDDAGWMFLGFIVAQLLVLQALDPFTFDWRSFLPPGLLVAIFAAVALGYRLFRPREDISAMLNSLQLVCLFCSFGAILSYMLAARGGAYWDAELQSWDRALGLDWLAYLAFVNDHPAFGSLIQMAYKCLIPQMIFLVVALSFCGKLREVRTATLAVMLAGVVTITISSLMPALSNFPYLNVSPELYANLRPSAAFVHTDHLEALRAGSMRHLPLNEMQGIVTFPSYHSALAAIFGWGFFQMRWLRWPGVGVAVATLLATPIDGGHYFVDVIAGLVVAALSIWLARRAVLFSAADALQAARRHLPVFNRPGLAPTTV